MEGIDDMAERDHRTVCTGIDIGGTYTKRIAMDNETHEIIRENQIRTTYDNRSGVAAGIVKSFQNCIRENNIVPGNVAFVVHSTIQTTNAFIEGDVASVGVVDVAGGGLEGFLAKCQLALEDIILGEKVSKMTKVYSTFTREKMLTEDVINQNIDELLGQGSQVIVTSMVFGVDNMDEEMVIHNCAEKKNMLATMASNITKLYRPARRIRTAAIDASILSKTMMMTDVTESSVRAAGITIPLMIMRGDDGIIEINEIRKRPVLTALSGPATPVMGSLMYLHAFNIIYFEVGGTTINIDVIKNGRPGADYAQIGGHDTYINSLDVCILGYAGDSMVRISDKAVMNVGPRSARIAGCEYAYFIPEEEIENPQVEMVSPKPGDPDDYVTIRSKNGECICFTNTYAANVPGPIEEQYFVRGNASATHKAIQPVADKLDITMEELTAQILDKDFEKVDACIDALAKKYQLDHENMKPMGCRGGAASLIPYYAEKMGLQYSTPESARVISSIGVVLPMVRDVIEHVIPNPSQDDTKELKEETADMAVSSGAPSDTAKAHIEVNNQTDKVTTIATGSTGVKTTDLLRECNKAEACELATQNLGLKVGQTALAKITDKFYIYQGLRDGRHSLHTIDGEEFIKVQCFNDSVMKCKVTDYEEMVEQVWKDEVAFKIDTVVRPGFSVCVGQCAGDYSVADLDQIYLLADLDLGGRKPDEDILTVTSMTEI